MTKINITLLGESGVGKTTLLLRFQTGEFQDTDKVKQTIGVEFHLKKLVLEGQEVVLFIWDTAGEERHRSVVRSYYRQGDGVLLVYDVTNPESFYKLSKWLCDLRDLNENAEVLIVGNKSEESSKNAVAVSAVKSFAEAEKVEYMEMSAKSGKNVEEAFLRLVKKILIAKGILTEKSSTDQPDSSSGNSGLEKIALKNPVPSKDPDIIRLDDQPTVKENEKACC